MQVSIINGSVEYDGEPILTEVNFTIHDKEKIAIVGRNGSGKTTLLKALTGEVELVEGTGNNQFVFSKQGNPNIGYLKQTFDGKEQRTLEEEILSAYQNILDIENKINLVLKELEDSSSEQNAKRYSTLHEEFERLGGYTYKKEYLTGLNKFGFSNDDLTKKLCEFSGGQRTKIALLKLLLSKPEVLLLDEPTNHLDLEAIEWLENYLSNYKYSLVVVSHDRMFLDKIVNIVYEIEYGETKRYLGNYTKFFEQKQFDYDKALKDSLLKKKEVERLTKLVERFRYKATKAKMAQSKLKAIERIGNIDGPSKFDLKTFNTNFQPDYDPVEKVLSIENLEFGYDKPLGKINTIIKKGQKVGIIGNNGCGKSTLIKTIMQILSPLSGRCYRGLNVDIGYFDQTLTQNYSPLSVFEDFHNEFPFLTDEEVRASLGAFNFSGDNAFKIVGDLSGGEKVRLALCKILKKKPNVLILDEPTNHMDIVGKASLEKMLENYTGTIIAVSHDRYFINKVCDRLFVFEDDGLNIYECNYSEFEALRKDKSNNDINSKTEIIKKERPISKEKELSKKLHRIKVLEEKITVIDNKKCEFNNLLLNDSSVFTNYEKIQEINIQLEKLEIEEKPLMDEWTILQESIDTI